MNATLLDRLVREIDDLLAPVADAVEDPFWLDRLMARLGVFANDSRTAALVPALKVATDLKTQFVAIAADPSPSFESIANLLKLADEAFHVVRALSTQGGPAADLVGLGQDLVELLLALHLATNHPVIYNLGVLLTLIEPVEAVTPTAPVLVGDQVVREPTAIPRFHLERLGALIRDPVTLLRAEYVNSLATVDDANAMADKLFGRVASLLNALSVPVVYGVGEQNRQFLGDAASLVDHALLIYVQDRAAGATVDAGVTLALSSADRGDLGLVVCPFGMLTFTKEVRSWAWEFDLTAEIEAFAYGRHGPTIVASPATTQIDGRFSATLAAPADEPAFVFGSPTGTRLEVGGAQLRAETALSEARRSLTLSAAVSSAAIVIAPGDGDSFLSSVLPADGLRAKFDLGVAWSNEHGFTFRGAAGLDATLPVDISMGGVSVPTVHLGLDASDAGFLAEVSASVGVSIGPVHGLVDRVGINTAVTFPEPGGNLGVADLHFGFKSPSGVGLAIDSQVVVGGGYLRFDPQTEEYSGILQLEVAETIAVKAIGLITTRLPDGSKGFSMLILISAEGFAPIQLGFGFTLTGVGGLLGVNRTVMVDVLRGGIKNGTLGSILFPKDPIRNAPQIVSDLRTVFPPVADRYLFGPMAIISWGTPTILSLELALILEIPEPIRLIILGRLQAILPDEKEVLVQVRMDAIGIIDFNKGDVSLDATLHDSRILEFTLTGDMALRANWGDEPNFVLAIGGFNPRFAAPAGFPQLDRLALSLSEGDELRLRCECYLALTSNTVQFGARLDLHAAGGGFTLDGYLGFDALFHFSPFVFVVDIGAGVALRYHGHLLMGIFLEGVFSGPTPWHVRGKATFKVLFFKVSVSIDHRFGGDEPAPLPEAVDVLTLLVAALSDARNWSGELPQGEHPLVSFRQESGVSTLRAHPLAELTVRQRVVPLNMTIDTFGNAPLSGSNRFTLAALRADGSAGELPLAATMMQESFALGQFQQISDDEMLSRPSFESRDAGIRFGTDEVAYRYDPLVDAEIEYETLMAVPGQDQVGGSPPPVYVMSASALDSVVATGAAGQAAIRRTGNARYRTTELVV